MAEEMTKHARKALRLGHVAGVMAAVSFGLGLYHFNGDSSSIKVVLFVILAVVWFIAAPIARLCIKPYRGQRRMSYGKWEYQIFLQSTVFSCLFIAVFLWLTFSTWKAADGELTIHELLKKFGM